LGRVRRPGREVAGGGVVDGRSHALARPDARSGASGPRGAPHVPLARAVRSPALHAVCRRAPERPAHAPNARFHGIDHVMDADAVELRVLGCLIEKQRTTPDQYPLSLNSLRLAANQATNRDPVVDYDEPTIRSALDRLARRNWTRLASGPSSRAAKFRHLLDDALRLTPYTPAPPG